MPTPQRIRDEAAQAEQQMEQLRQQSLNGNPPPQAPAPGNEPQTPPRDSDTQFGIGQQVEPINGDEPPENGSGPVTAEQLAAVQQQLATLQGNFGQQGARLQAALERAQLLERTLERALERGNEPVPATPAPTAPVVSRVTQAQIDEFGADLTDFIKSLCAEAVQTGVAPVLDQLQRLHSAVTETSGIARNTAAQTEQQATHDYVQRMNSLVKDANGNPDWEYINTMHNERGDNRFIDWLNKTGEDSDEPRLRIIQRAFAKKDADRCARMINNFKRDVGMADGTQAPSSAPTQQPAARAAALVSPSTQGSGSGAPRGRPPAKTYTKEDIDRHYTEKTKGAWKGKEAEWKAIADDMDRAVLESRFVAEQANRRGR